MGSESDYSDPFFPKSDSGIRPAVWQLYFPQFIALYSSSSLEDMRFFKHHSSISDLSFFLIKEEFRVVSSQQESETCGEGGVMGSRLEFTILICTFQVDQPQNP